MLDCKQLQVGDYCVATVPRSRSDPPPRPMPPLASVGVRQNQEDLRSPSDVTDVVMSRNARKRRLLSATQASANLPAWPSEEFVASPSGSSQWNPWSSADLRVSPEVEEEQERTRLEPLEPTDLRTSKSREEEEEEGEICSGRSWENVSLKGLVQSSSP